MAGRFESLTLAGVSTAQPGRTVYVADDDGAVREISYQLALSGTTEAVVQPEVSANGITFTALGSASTVSSTAAEATIFSAATTGAAFSHARLRLVGDTTGTVTAWMVGA